MTEAQHARIGANRERAKRRKALNSTKPSGTRKREACTDGAATSSRARTQEPDTGGPEPTPPPEAADSVGSAGQPTTAELRLAGVVERVLARIRARTVETHS